MFTSKPEKAIRIMTHAPREQVPEHLRKLDRDIDLVRDMALDASSGKKRPCAGDFQCPICGGKVNWAINAFGGMTAGCLNMQCTIRFVI